MKHCNMGKWTISFESNCFISELIWLGDKLITLIRKSKRKIGICLNIGNLLGSLGLILLRFRLQGFRSLGFRLLGRIRSDYSRRSRNGKGARSSDGQHSVSRQLVGNVFQFHARRKQVAGRKLTTDEAVFNGALFVFHIDHKEVIYTLDGQLLGFEVAHIQSDLRAMNEGHLKSSKKFFKSNLQWTCPWSSSFRRFPTCSAAVPKWPVRELWRVICIFVQ